MILAYRKVRMYADADTDEQCLYWRKTAPYFTWGSYKELEAEAKILRRKKHIKRLLKCGFTEREIEITSSFLMGCAKMKRIERGYCGYYAQLNWRRKNFNVYRKSQNLYI